MIGGRPDDPSLPVARPIGRHDTAVMITESRWRRAEADAKAVAEIPTEIHAVKHREYPVWGVQFHPESILTESGKEILRNFLTIGR